MTGRCALSCLFVFFVVDLDCAAARTKNAAKVALRGVRIP